jgi:hypothetical protein
MKKLTLVFAIGLFTINANAQIKKGAVLLGGQIAGLSSKSEIINQPFPSPGPIPAPSTQNITQKITVIGLNVGAAIAQNKILGINFSTASSNQSYLNTGYDTASSKRNQYTVGAFYRQYKKIANNFYFFAQGDAAAVFGNGTTTYSFNPSEYTSKESGGALSFTPGISYEIVKHVQIELTLPSVFGFQFSSSTQSSTNPNIRTATNSTTAFYSSLSNNSGLGALGIGFKLIL